MPRYAPQSLPGMPPNAPEPPRLHQNLGTIVAQAAQLGRSIQREQGLQGVRAYVAAMVPFLAPHEHMELAQALGVPCSAPREDSPPPPPQHQPPQPNGNSGNSMGGGSMNNPGNPSNMGNMNQMGNMAQMMQMLNQFSGMQGGSPGGGGMNPMLLAQMMQMLNQKR